MGIDETRERDRGESTRRSFLGRTACLTLGAAAALAPGTALVARAEPEASAKPETPAKPTSDAIAPVKPKAPPKPRPLPFKLSLAEWSLHKALFDKRIDPLDFAVVANGLGFDAVEYVNQFFPDKAKSKDYLAEMKRRAAGEGVWSVLIMIDREGALGDPDKTKRTATVDNHKKWVEAAAYLGCHAIRVNAHSEGAYEEQIKFVAEGLRALTEYAEPHGINVIVENHGGLSSDGAWLTRVMTTVGHPRCGTLPDFGNFRIDDKTEYDRYKGVRQLMPFAKAVSAKSYDFDGQGNETKIDYRKMLEIVTEAGYHGYVGVEYEGKRLDEYDGIRKTKRLLERVRKTLIET